MVYLLEMVIFHGYVKEPDGNTFEYHAIYWHILAITHFRMMMIQPGETITMDGPAKSCTS